jgi:hypothetical protein
MTDSKSTKVTFYAEPDIKEWLDSLDLGAKSKTINELLREGMLDQKTEKQEVDRFDLLEGRIRKLEKDNQFDGLAIAALRRVLLNRHGDLSAAEFKKEFDDLYFGAPRAPRNVPT